MTRDTNGISIDCHLSISSAAGFRCDTQSVARLDCVPRVSVETIKHYTRQLDLSPGLQTPSYHPAGAWCQPSAQPHNIIVLESENGLAEMEISTFLAVIMDTYTTGFLMEGNLQPHLNCIFLFIFFLLMCWVATLALWYCRFSCLNKTSSLWGTFILLLSETEVQVRGKSEVSPGANLRTQVCLLCLVSSVSNWVTSCWHALYLEPCPAIKCHLSQLSACSGNR